MKKVCLQVFSTTTNVNINVFSRCGETLLSKTLNGNYGNYCFFTSLDKIIVKAVNNSQNKSIAHFVKLKCKNNFLSLKFDFGSSQAILNFFTLTDENYGFPIKSGNLYFSQTEN